jgi:hypothetical protein
MPPSKVHRCGADGLSRTRTRHLLARRDDALLDQVRDRRINGLHGRCDGLDELRRIDAGERRDAPLAVRCRADKDIAAAGVRQGHDRAADCRTSGFGQADRARRVKRNVE